MDKNYLLKISRLIAITLVSIISLSSCSVAMAAKREGISVSKIQRCDTRMQLVSLGGEIMSRNILESGDIVEIYRFKEEKGSTSRAVMHGLLDVSTFCIWEVVGTPLEARKSNEFFSVKVVYDSGENIKNIFLN
jgi:hypothetical protein